MPFRLTALTVLKCCSKPWNARGKEDESLDNNININATHPYRETINWTELREKNLKSETRLKGFGFFFSNPRRDFFLMFRSVLPGCQNFIRCAQKQLMLTFCVSFPCLTLEQGCSNRGSGCFSSFCFCVGPEASLLWSVSQGSQVNSHFFGEALVDGAALLLVPDQTIPSSWPWSSLYSILNLSPVLVPALRLVTFQVSVTAPLSLLRFQPTCLPMFLFYSQNLVLSEIKAFYCVI